jgi:hypothetical protein
MGAGILCNFDEGRPVGPQTNDTSFVEAIEVSELVPCLKARWVEPGWPEPLSSLGPIGWPRPVEHPPRTNTARRR